MIENAFRNLQNQRKSMILKIIISKIKDLEYNELNKKIDTILDYSTRNKFFEDDNFFTNQVEGFMYFLNNYMIDQEKVVSEPIMTPAKKSIVNVNTTDLKANILEIIEENIMDWKKDIDKNYWISYTLVYNAYVQVKMEGKKRPAKNKFSYKLKVNDFEVEKKTIDSENDTYVKVPYHLVEAFYES